MEKRSISKQTLLRLPLYLNYMKQLGNSAPEHISATTISEVLRLNHVVVRKDIASVSSAGKPKVGYVTQDLIRELEDFLGFNEQDDAVIVGAGKLGKALLAYRGFDSCGIRILAAFDADPAVLCTDFGGRPVLPMEDMEGYCRENRIRIGIITVPTGEAQAVCDRLLSCGIEAIWNFAPVHLSVPEGVLVHNENLAASMALLAKKLREK